MDGDSVQLVVARRQPVVAADRRRGILDEDGRRRPLPLLPSPMTSNQKHDDNSDHDRHQRHEDAETGDQHQLYHSVQCCRLLRGTDDWLMRPNDRIRRNFTRRRLRGIDGRLPPHGSVLLCRSAVGSRQELATWTGKSERAAAFVAAGRRQILIGRSEVVDADGAVQTRRRTAAGRRRIVRGSTARRIGDTRRTVAPVTVYQVDAGRPGHTRRRGAFVVVELAQRTVESWRAPTPETVDAVEAFGAVHAWLGGAVVDIRLAEDAGISGGTHTSETIHVIDTATTCHDTGKTTSTVKQVTAD